VAVAWLNLTGPTKSRTAVVAFKVAVESVGRPAAPFKTLLAELPSEDELEDLNKVAGSLVANLEQAWETFNADNFPVVDGLESIAEWAG
jgi:hypothetical protein